MQAAAAVAQLLAALVLIVVTWRYVALTDKLVRGQIEPLVAFEFDTADTALVVGNDGIHPVTNLSVIVDTLVFAGPPRNTPLTGLRSGRPIPGRARPEWWRIQSLARCEVQKKTLSDLVDNAGQMIRMSEKTRAENARLRGFPTTDRTQIYAIMICRLTYHRDVDSRRYRGVKKLAVFMDDAGNPAVWDTELVSSFVGEAIEKLPPEDEP